MTEDIRLKVPAANLNKSVRNFMLLGGCTLNQFNAYQAGLYTGLQLEEMAEKVEAVMSGCVSPHVKQDLSALVKMLTRHSQNFKAGLHYGDVLRGDRLGMLDADIDLAWVALGGAYSTSNNVDGAVEAVGVANISKFPGGVCTKDANGKICKPLGWTPPDLGTFVTLAVE